MIRKVVLSCLVLLIAFYWSQGMTIKEAKSKGLIALDIKENSTGTHYHSPFVMTLKNLSTTSLNLDLENGTTLIPEDEYEQNFIITNSLFVQLKVNEQKSVDVFAMCIEQSDAAPRESSKYTIGDLANDDLRKLSLFVEKNKRFEPDAQFLMWAIAEGEYPSESIDDFSIDEDGIVWVMNITGTDRQKVEPVIPDVEEFQKGKLMVNGSFNMDLARPKNVHIALFNANNVIVKELYKNPNTPSGSTQLDYSFNSYDYEEETYFVKVVVNGEVLLTRTIDMRF